jgi:AmiR/NasT family two-component response regulator
MHTASVTCPRCGSEAVSNDDELIQAREMIGNLQAALQSARVISAAVGIVMERMKVPMEEAFDVLVYVSQHDHRKLRDVADRLVFTGELSGTWVKRANP